MHDTHLHSRHDPLRPRQHRTAQTLNIVSVVGSLLALEGILFSPWITIAPFWSDGESEAPRIDIDQLGAFLTIPAWIPIQFLLRNRTHAVISLIPFRSMNHRCPHWCSSLRFVVEMSVKIGVKTTFVIIMGPCRQGPRLFGSVRVGLFFFSFFSWFHKKPLLTDVREMNP